MNNDHYQREGTLWRRWLRGFRAILSVRYPQASLHDIDIVAGTSWEPFLRGCQARDAGDDIGSAWRSYRESCIARTRSESTNISTDHIRRMIEMAREPFEAGYSAEGRVPSLTRRN